MALHPRLVYKDVSSRQVCAGRTMRSGQPSVSLPQGPGFSEAGVAEQVRRTCQTSFRKINRQFDSFTYLDL